MAQRKGQGKRSNVKSKPVASKRTGSKSSRSRGAGSAAAGKAIAEAELAIARAKASAFVDLDPARAFAHFRPLAEKEPTDGLLAFTGQPLLLRGNVVAALEAMGPHLATAVAALREPRVQELFELPALVMALDFATTRVPIAKLSAGEIDAMLSEGAPWRELTLKYLEVVSHPLLDLLPRERVAKIRAGTGKLDKAEDFVAIPGLFAEYASALDGKHPFAVDRLDLLATLGGTLLQQVTPGNAPMVIAKRTPEALVRDQLAHLVSERFDHLQVLAAVALGKRAADALLPALRSAISFGTPTQPAPAPQTNVTPAGTTA